MYPESDQDTEQLPQMEYAEDAASRSSVAVSELAAPMGINPTDETRSRPPFVDNTAMLLLEQPPTAPSGSTPLSGNTGVSPPAATIPPPSRIGFPPLKADHIIRDLHAAYGQAQSFSTATYAPELAKKYVEILVEWRSTNTAWSHAKGGAGATVFENTVYSAKKVFCRNTLLFLPRGDWCERCAKVYDEVMANPAVHRGRLLWPSVVSEDQLCIACVLYRLDSLRQDPPILPGRARVSEACSHKHKKLWTMEKWDAARAVAATATAAPRPQHGPASASRVFTSPLMAGSTQAVRDPVRSTSILPPVAFDVVPSPVSDPAVATTILPGVGSTIENPIVFQDDDDDVADHKTSLQPQEPIVKPEPASSVKREELVKHEGAASSSSAQQIVASADEVRQFAVTLKEGHPLRKRLTSIETSLREAGDSALARREVLKQAMDALASETMFIAVDEALGETLKAMEKLYKTLS